MEDQVQRISLSALFSYLQQKISGFFSILLPKHGLIESNKEIERSEGLPDQCGQCYIRPKSIKLLCDETRFSVESIKFLYRIFKQECPTGVATAETFNNIYEKIFPLGDCSKYAQLIFTSFDKRRRGWIYFEEFMETMSILCRGDVDERIDWCFQFYDVNGDGVISRDDAMKVSLLCSQICKFLNRVLSFCFY